VPRNGQPRGKIFRQKELGWLAAARAKHAKGERGKLTARRIGRETAYEDLVDHEHCLDLAGEFARESGRKTGDPIGEISHRYQTIAIDLRAVRYTQADGKPYSLGTVLYGKFQSDAELKEFLRGKFTDWIGKYVSECIQHRVRFTTLYRQIAPIHTWTLYGHDATRDLLTALAEEYVRDRAKLIEFLDAALKRWRKIDQPHSVFRMKLLINQYADDVQHHRIAQRLKKIGAAPEGSDTPGTSANRKLRSKIKKIRSRDRKSAAEKIGKALARETTPAAELKARLECPSCGSKWTHGISICPQCKVPVRKARR
jgi:hypothetical protein